MRALLALALLLPLFAPAAHAEPPARFDRELELMRRFIACDARADAVKPPPNVNPKATSRLCDEVERRIGIFKRRWYDKAAPLLAEIVPKDIPSTVVYPFGGADLLHALATFPDASLITTLSLEWVGDPRAIKSMKAAEFMSNVKQQHAFLIKLFQVNHSRTVDLQALNKSPVPAPLVFALTALGLYGYEPIEARYFDLDDSGAIVYLTDAAIAAFDGTKAARKQMERNAFFANVELRFRRAGQEPEAPVQVWRHLKANLHDDHFKGSAVEKHLLSLGTFSAMTKAASYLIWREDFSGIRDLLLDRMAWMISDTTGIAPYHAAARGFTQEVWGRFVGNLFPGAKKAETAMIELWAAAEARALPVQFGYPDKEDNNHLMVTRR